MQHEARLKTIAICSVKGLVRKTFSALSLCSEFSIRGVGRILIPDAGPSRNTSVRVLAEIDDVSMTLADLFKIKDAKIGAAIYDGKLRMTKKEVKCG